MNKFEEILRMEMPIKEILGALFNDEEKNGLMEVFVSKIHGLSDSELEDLAVWDELCGNDPHMFVIFFFSLISYAESKGFLDSNVSIQGLIQAVINLDNM